MKINCIKALILVLALMPLIECGKCPAEELRYFLLPCVCNDIKNETFCNSTENLGLKKVFEYMIQTNDLDTKYNQLIINAPELTQLEETAFVDIAFIRDILVFNVKKLKSIESNAFGRTMFDGPDQLTSSLPNAFSSLVNESIELIGTDVSAIPEHTFISLIGNPWKLTTVTLIGNIQKIDNFSFYYLYWTIRKISLGNQIRFIAEHAFDMRTSSHIRLTINLSNNQLSADSFEAGVFLNSKRALYLNLTNNKLTHFEEFIFEPFLDLNVMNQIDIKDNALVCDCRMKWLLKNKHNYEKQVVNAVCIDGRSLWSYSMDEINECKITDVIV